uniref:Uncharacterized protein n=1 Tax=Panagrolaimus davidi TaxID=227884 RepID=A0A914R2D2_9BILA
MTAVNCTKKLLDEMRKRGEWPRPTSATPAEFIFKKCQQFNIVIPIESSAARLFIFHYIGIDIIIFITPEIIRRIYEEYFKATANWYENAQCLKNYRGEIIFNQYPNPDYVYYPESVAKVKLVLETVYENSQKFNHLRTCQLILHRIIVYLACTMPMWYKINITTKKLAVYYAILGKGVVML